jgi:hypothetical protein
MIREPYGVLINLIVKVFVGLVSAAGITVTEFWWKLPVALIGTLFIPLSYFFLCRIGASKKTALAGAAIFCVLPVHVMQSRYLWGYEVLGAFFLVLAIWSLLDFFEKPSMPKGLVASFACGLYLVSHVYITPFVVCIAAMTVICGDEGRSVRDRFLTNLHLLVSRLVWVFPLVFALAYKYPLARTAQKPTQPGFYLDDHFGGFLGNIGLPLLVLLLVGLASIPWLEGRHRKHSSLLAISAVGYLFPLFFLTPPGTTVVRGYMLVGTCLLALAAAKGFEKWFSKYPGVTGVVLVSALLFTLWGTEETVFWEDTLFDPTLVRVERGEVAPDPGTKAAGYLIRRHIPDSATVMALHRKIEPPNLYYYFGRTRYSYYDKNLIQLWYGFLKHHDKIDVIIAEKDIAREVIKRDVFQLRAVLFSHGEPTMWIFAKPEIPCPWGEFDVANLNRLYDQHYAPEVDLW